MPASFNGSFAFVTVFQDEHGCGFLDRLVIWAPYDEYGA